MNPKETVSPAETLKPEELTQSGTVLDLEIEDLEAKIAPDSYVSFILRKPMGNHNETLIDDCD